MVELFAFLKKKITFAKTPKKLYDLNITILLLLSTLVGMSQNDIVKIDAKLNYTKSEIQVKQEIVFHNKTDIPLDTLYFHNWSNSYKDKHTPLSKRLIENYDKSLFFAKIKKRGSSIIKGASSNYTSTKWEVNDKSPDIVSIILNESLEANDSITLSFTYLIKIPEDIFTGYGKNGTTYNLRFWHIVPAVFDKQWQLMSNLNMDDLYMNPADYSINFIVPEGLKINTDLDYTKTINHSKTIYHLSGKNRVDIELNLTLLNDFNHFDTSHAVEVITNLNGTILNHQVKNDIINRELAFLKKHIGPYPHDKLLVNKISYDKNPIYGLNQLPKMFNPFSRVFEWDIKMFKVLTKKYLENTIVVNRRKDAWIIDGIQTFLMMKYVEQYYSEVKAMGNISKIWGIRSFTIAKLDFNEKYPFVYQFAARRNYDQALTTRADSLSNFNRKIVNKYKAGLGLQYLDEYLNDSIVFSSIKQFYKKSLLKNTNSKLFKDIITQKTDKDLSWFFGGYLQSKKKIDYTIKKVSQTNDSITVTIKNNRNFTAPVALYGVQQKGIKFRKWLTDIDSTATVTIPKGDFNKLSLNYEYLYPELNLRDNWKNLNGIFNRPIQFRFFKDVEDPYYNQIFYNLFVNYNFYDGLLIGPRVYNEAIFKKKLLYKITPTFGTKSKKLTGSFSIIYQHIPEETSVYRYRAGIAGSSFHYAPELTFKRLVPFMNIQFKRKSLRDVGGSALSARYVIINRETEPNSPSLESDKYNVLNIKYGYSKPDIIRDLRYNFDVQLANNFSKLAIDFRYRKLTDTHRQYDFRAYLGTFIHNKTQGDFFSFSLDRPSDYLFDYDFLGRSEQAGFYSQQIIIAEGGFKSMFENPYANQWMFTTNSSISIWRWIEAYADAGFYKNRATDPIFRYDSGIRLNLVHNILEVYFPLQSSLGFEPSLPNYGTKIRFVLSINPERIINSARRGFF
ncbi:MAG: aminopeptidase [Flavobacteriaceae bacterium]|nr:aminopeptidase [Flavobacteriaceae bacterium]